MLTIAGTATASSFRLRLHYKAARAAGVSELPGGMSYEKGLGIS